MTDAPTFSIGWAVRVAVTTSSATPLAPTLPATSASGAFWSSAIAAPETRTVARAVELKNARIMVFYFPFETTRALTTTHP